MPGTRFSGTRFSRTDFPDGLFDRLAPDSGLGYVPVNPIKGSPKPVPPPSLNVFDNDIGSSLILPFATKTGPFGFLTELSTEPHQ